MNENMLVKISEHAEKDDVERDMNLEGFEPPQSICRGARSDRSLL
jgi:hypothetical protein